MKFECNKCHQELPPEKFYVRWNKKQPTTRSDWVSSCMECDKQYKKDWYQTHREESRIKAKERRERDIETSLKKEAEYRLKKHKNKDTLIAYRKVCNLNEFDFYMHSRHRQWRSSAKKRGFEFRLTFDDLIDLFKTQEGRCFYTKEILILKSKSDMTISLDRVDPTKDYTKDNVVFCGTKINLIKLDLSLQEFKDTIAKLHPNLNIESRG
jgi:hypothetical protein